MSILRSVNLAVDSQCLSRQCTGGRCSLQMPRKHQDWILINMDSPSAPLNKSKRRCDYIFFGKIEGEEEWTIPIELKEGDVDASQVALQLQAGAEVADKILRSSDKVKFLPVVVSGKFYKREKRELEREKNKIRFRNTKVIIERIKCKSKLADVLK